MSNVTKGDRIVVIAGVDDHVAIVIEERQLDDVVAIVHDDGDVTGHAGERNGVVSGTTVDGCASSAGVDASDIKGTSASLCEDESVCVRIASDDEISRTVDRGSDISSQSETRFERFKRTKALIF